MAVKAIPDGYHAVTPYLVVEGVDRCLQFMSAAFGAQEKLRMPRADGSIGHAETRIGDSLVMLGEAGGDNPPMPATLHLYVEDCDATYRRALEAGGTSLREPTDQFYGDRMAGVRDPAGNCWWIATHIEDLSDEQLVARAEQA
jgi:PhnB protein